MLSRPLTYIDWTVSSTDAAEHQTQIYFDAGADLVVNTSDEPVTWGRFLLDGQPVLRIGSREQAVLAKRGDDLRIDWGYLYLTADSADGVTSAAVSHQSGRTAFNTTGKLPDSDDLSESIVTPVAAPAGDGAGGKHRPGKCRNETNFLVSDAGV